MRKLQRVQNEVLKALIRKGSWTYHGFGQGDKCEWVYDGYRRTYEIMQRLADRGIVTSRTNGETEVFLPNDDAADYLRKDELVPVNLEGYVSEYLSKEQAQ